MAEQKVEQLYNEFSQEIFRYLFKLSKSEDLAKDLLQETFINAFRYLEQKKEVRFERGWLYKIAYRTFLRHQKTVKKRSEIPYIDDIEAPQSDFTRAIHQKTLMANIRELLAEKEPIYAEIFDLKIANEMNQQEICNLLGISERTLRRYLTNLRRVIEQHFKDDL